MVSIYEVESKMREIVQEYGWGKGAKVQRVLQCRYIWMSYSWKVDIPIKRTGMDKRSIQAKIC